MQYDTAAFFISIASAIFTAASLFYMRRQANVAVEAARRPDLIVETTIGKQSEEIAGWTVAHLVIRNLAPARAVVTAAKVKKRNQSILSMDDAFDEAENPWGERNKPRNSLPEQRATKVSRAVNPCGTQAHAHGIRAGDTIYLDLFVKNVSKPSDLTIEWHWADGYKKKNT